MMFCGVAYRFVVRKGKEGLLKDAYSAAWAEKWLVWSKAIEQRL